MRKKIIILTLLALSFLLNCKKEKEAVVEDASKQGPVSIPLKVVVTNPSGLTIRSESKLESAVLGQVEKGKEIVINKQVGDIVTADDKNFIWVEVVYGDKVGYTNIEAFSYNSESVQVEKTPFEIDTKAFCLELDPKDFPKNFESACFGDFQSCTSAQRSMAGLILKADGSYEVSLSNEGERFGSLSKGKWKKDKNSIQLNGELVESFPGNEIKYKVKAFLGFDKSGKIGLNKYQEKFVSNTSPDCEGKPQECGALETKDIEKLRTKTPFEPQDCLYPLDLNKKVWEKEQRWSENLGKMNYAAALKKCESMNMSLPSVAQWKKAETYNIPIEQEKDGHWAKSFPQEEGKYSMVTFFATQGSYYLYDSKAASNEEFFVRCIKE